uniref:Uncharacterized protein LOC112815345 n=1 Tax=Callorhinus ursinus TaxID=34884 RepID=A0A3Q7N6H7_CALUR|nr:uncharacterized protein LOC112815345 [Callorhinus ursinus]
MGSGTPGQAVAGGRLSLGPGPPRAGRHRKMAAASARLRPAKWRECRVPGWSGAGRARGACARRWAGPRCVARAAAPGLPPESREGSAVAAPSQFRKLGSEKRGPPRLLACVSGATWRGFSQPVKSRLELASAPHVRLHVEAPPSCPARGAQPPSPRGRPTVDQALRHAPPRCSGWGLGSCSPGGAPRSAAEPGCGPGRPSLGGGLCAE